MFYARRPERNRGSGAMVGCAPVIQPTRRASPWILLPVLAVCAAGSLKNTGDDLHRYFAYANATLGRPFDDAYVHAPATNRPLLPYRDFFMEYPPGFFLAAVPPALPTTNEAAYEALFEALMAACLAGALWCCVRISSELGNRLEPSELAIWGLIGVAALGKVTFQRYDAVVALCVCLMCWSTITRRPIVLGLAAAAGAAAKLVPLFVAILCGIYLVRARRFREAANAAVSATVIGLVIFAPVILSGGADGLIGMLRYHLDRPLEFETRRPRCSASGMRSIRHRPRSSTATVPATSSDALRARPSSSRRRC